MFGTGHYQSIIEHHELPTLPHEPPKHGRATVAHSTRYMHYNATQMPVWWQFDRGLPNGETCSCTGGPGEGVVMGVGGRQCETLRDCGGVVSSWCRVCSHTPNGSKIGIGMITALCTSACSSFGTPGLSPDDEGDVCQDGVYGIGVWVQRIRIQGCYCTLTCSRACTSPFPHGESMEALSYMQMRTPLQGYSS